VEADFPARLSRRMRSMVSFFGMIVVPIIFRQRFSCLTMLLTMNALRDLAWAEKAWS
jgi:hypothetical protein